MAEKKKCPAELAGFNSIRKDDSLILKEPKQFIKVNLFGYSTGKFMEAYFG